MKKHNVSKQENVFNMYKWCDYRLIHTLPVSTGKMVLLLMEMLLWPYSWNFKVIIFGKTFKIPELKKFSPKLPTLSPFNCKESPICWF